MVHAAASRPPAPIPQRLQQQPPPAAPSYATQLSLRGADTRPSHPLKQNPPSIAEDDYSDIPLREPPSALLATTNYQGYDPRSPLEHISTPLRTAHQRSLTGTFFDNCKPVLDRAASTLQQHTTKTSFHSPTKSLASFIPSRGALESSASQPKIRAGAKALGDWFNGSSAPVNIGVAPASPSKEHPDQDYDSEEEEEEEEEEEGQEHSMMSNIFNRSPALTRSATATDSTPKQSSPAPAKTQAPTAGSKFAWLLNTQKNAAVPPPVPSPTYHNPSDELLNLNISQSLFPHGPVDPLAPSSFNDLLSTAETLLTRYQNSYRALSTSLNDARAEQSAQDDELDEAETRVRHLKMQLETMAARATEQDDQMQRLVEELTFERRARKEEEEARKRSLALIRGPVGAHLAGPESPRRRNRVSNSDVSVDSGFESENDSEAASIFSRANGAMSPVDTIPSSAASINEVNDTTPKGKRPQPLQRRSTYDKVRDGTVHLERGAWGCSNCEGGSQSTVWGRLAKEREENSMLRRRVYDLEEAVDGALNVVDGPWGM